MAPKSAPAAFQVIDIPGYGEVEFPDSMSDDEVNAAVKKLRMDADFTSEAMPPDRASLPKMARPQQEPIDPMRRMSLADEYGDPAKGLAADTLRSFGGMAGAALGGGATAGWGAPLGMVVGQTLGGGLANAIDPYSGRSVPEGAKQGFTEGVLGAAGGGVLGGAAGAAFSPFTKQALWPAIRAGMAFGSGFSKPTPTPWTPEVNTSGRALYNTMSPEAQAEVQGMVDSGLKITQPKTVLPQGLTDRAYGQEALRTLAGKAKEKAATLGRAVELQGEEARLHALGQETRQQAVGANVDLLGVSRAPLEQAALEAPHEAALAQGRGMAAGESADVAHTIRNRAEQAQLSRLSDEAASAKSSQDSELNDLANTHFEANTPTIQPEAADHRSMTSELSTHRAPQVNSVLGGVESEVGVRAPTSEATSVGRLTGRRPQPLNPQVGAPHESDFQISPLTTGEQPTPAQTTIDYPSVAHTAEELRAMQPPHHFPQPDPDVMRQMAQARAGRPPQKPLVTDADVFAATRDVPAHPVLGLDPVANEASSNIAHLGNKQSAIGKAISDVVGDTAKTQQAAKRLGLDVGIPIEGVGGQPGLRDLLKQQEADSLAATSLAKDAHEGGGEAIGHGLVGSALRAIQSKPGMHERHFPNTTLGGLLGPMSPAEIDAAASQWMIDPSSVPTDLTRWPQWTRTARDMSATIGRSGLGDWLYRHTPTSTP